MKDASRVKLFTRENSRHITTRDVDSLLFCTTKEQSSNPNMSLFSLKSLSHTKRGQLGLYQFDLDLHWKDLFFISFNWSGLIVAEHEYVTPDRVSMEVAKEEDVTTFQCPLHHQLCVVVNRVELAGRSNPLAIEVLAHQRAAVVTNDDTVRVEHGHDFEHECVSEELGAVLIAHKEVYHAIHHPRGIALAWMHACRQYD